MSSTNQESKAAKESKATSTRPTKGEDLSEEEFEARFQRMLRERGLDRMFQHHEPFHHQHSGHGYHSSHIREHSSSHEREGRSSSRDRAYSPHSHPLSVSHHHSPHYGSSSHYSPHFGSSDLVPSHFGSDWGIGAFDVNHPRSTGALGSIDIVETDSEIVFKSDTPGLTSKDVEVYIDNDETLTITGERKREVEVDDGTIHRIERVSGSFKRTFHLPKNVQTENMQASVVNGVLKVVVPKKQVKASSRRSIPIKDD